MQNLEGCGTLLCGQFIENTAADYDIACTRCEKLVVLNFGLYQLLCHLLEYDKRKDGCHGRALSYDRQLAYYGLTATMRLEPSEFLADVGAFEDIRTFPHPVRFWDTAEETLVRHRCPLFSTETGPFGTLR